MVPAARPFDDFSSPRVAQLTQRSNQFNLRTVRYTEGDVAALRGDPGAVGLSFTLRDRFGDHGLVSVVVLRIMEPDTAFIALVCAAEPTRLTEKPTLMAGRTP